MLSAEEEKFLYYWEKERENKKKFLRKLSIGMPLGVLIAVALLVSLLSGWYRRATAELNADGSLMIVILVALVGIVVFFTIFSAHHRWDRNEAAYQDLLKKKSEDAAGTAKS
jgi:pilus assembly protein TadC